LIILKEEIDFNSRIAPICLTRLGSPALSVTKGTVIGYGKTEESNDYSKVPKKADAPIHDIQTCIRTYPSISTIASNTTFCGGHGNGTGACTGDSGGGLFVDYKNVYYLRGIVSSSLRDTKLGCNVDAYALYTNVTKFIKWIEDINVSDSDVTSRGKFSKSWSPKPRRRPTLRPTDDDKL
jgi:secreted trypsin-like serine protease